MQSLRPYAVNCIRFYLGLPGTTDLGLRSAAHAGARSCFVVCLQVKTAFSVRRISLLSMNVRPVLGEVRR